MDPGLGWKPAHTGVSAHVDAELRIWLTPGWSQTRLNHVNPREREISSPEAGTLLPQHATLPALPTRRRGQRHRSHLKKYTAAADDGIGSWRFGWRETVATPRPEDTPLSFQTAIAIQEHIESLHEAAVSVIPISAAACCWIWLITSCPCVLLPTTVETDGMEKEHGETLASRTRARLVCYQYQTSPQHAALSAIYETLKTIRSRSLIA